LLKAGASFIFIAMENLAFMWGGMNLLPPMQCNNFTLFPSHLKASGFLFRMTVESFYSLQPYAYNMAPYCSSSDWLAMKIPAKNSRKGDNGKLLIISGNEKYHGSAVLALLAATRFCDLVYFHSTAENAKIAKSFLYKVKSSTPCVICGKDNEMERHIAVADAILIGPGIGRESKAKKGVLAAIGSKKPVVLDADALHLIKPKQLHAKCLITPHEGEFRALFGCTGTIANVKRMAKKYNCVILKKGQVDVIASSTNIKLNCVHNAGMTKGGTGDVLAGLAAALLSSGNPLFQSACASAYLNGYAGNLLIGRFRYHFDAHDLALELGHAAAKIERGK
jgi:hydroxyethylthiazole kinase-like uncharacterized protein yjeF